DSERLLESGSWRLSHDAQNAMVWTPQLRRLLELPADESASLQALLERVHPEDQHLLRATLRQSWLSGQPFRLEHRLLFSDGRTSLVLHFGDTHCDETGAALETLGILQPLGDQTSLKEALERATHRDSLTGLPNRLASLEQLEQLLQAAPYNQQIAVLCFDLDKFQNINDSFGVEIGNDLLRWIAAHLRAQLAPSDWLAHLDADTFLIIRREGVRSLATALDLARTLQESLKHVVPELEPLRALQLSACLGVSVAPDHGSQASGLLQSASTALSEAKQQGPGTIRSYSTAMSQRIRETLDIEQRLARAIDRQELRLEYQTQWDREGQLIGAEALLRWHTHRGEEIQPSLFIPLAEQSGLMRDIGPWVLEQSIRQLDLWNRAGCHLPRLAINVSAQQFSSEAIPLDERLLALCEQYQVSPDQLEIELTETALLQNQALAAQTMERLARCGVTLAIDDFGTGYSSLVTLQQLPVHRLKIDRCFIQDLATSPSDQTIVKATIGMAHELGLNCLAEGVETEAQQRMLQHLGCDSFQGFGLGHPIPPEQIQALLSTAPVKAMQLA
ncbi:MAG: putative bifunctional diguanylate cyclase/phosphodiesterase, partial [Vulcanococcus sp.]